MQIFIRRLPGPTSALEVERTDSIDNVRQKIQDRLGIDPIRQLLYFEGELLQDGFTLADYDVEKEATLDLLVPPEVAAYSTIGIEPPPEAGAQLCVLGVGRSIAQRIDVSGPRRAVFSFWSVGVVGWEIVSYVGDERLITIAAGEASSSVMSQTMATVEVPVSVTSVEIVLTGDLPGVLNGAAPQQVGADAPAVDLVSLRLQAEPPDPTSTTTTTTPAPTTTAPGDGGGAGTAAAPRFTG